MARTPTVLSPRAAGSLALITSEREKYDAFMAEYLTNIKVSIAAALDAGCPVSRIQGVTGMSPLTIQKYAIEGRELGTPEGLSEDTEPSDIGIVNISFEEDGVVAHFDFDGFKPTPYNDETLTCWMGVRYDSDTGWFIGGTDADDPRTQSLLQETFDGVFDAEERNGRKSDWPLAALWFDSVRRSGLPVPAA